MSDQSNARLMTVWKDRPDLRTLYPEAASGDLTRLMIWAISSSRIDAERTKLKPYLRQYAESLLKQIYARREDLQALFPEASKSDLRGLTEHVAGMLEFCPDGDGDIVQLKPCLDFYRKLVGHPAPPMAAGMKETLILHELDSSIGAHLPTLHLLTKSLRLTRVLELGVERGNSTVAFLEATAEINGHLWSVDLANCEEAKAVVRKLGLEAYWTFVQGNDLTVDWNEPIDHLFIDTLHVYPHTLAELRKYEPFVTPGGLITLHDSIRPGVSDAVRDYFRQRPDIEVYEYRNSNGLLVIRKERALTQPCSSPRTEEA